MLAAILIITYFVFTTLCLYINVELFAPLWVLMPSVAPRAMGYTKRLFAIILITIQQFRVPASIELYTEEGHCSFDIVNGKLRSSLNSQAVVISNHVLYSDWLYLWWIAYTSKLAGALTIALKASLKKIPVIGWGMIRWRFLFLERDWAKDQKIIQSTMNDLQAGRQASWMVLFPEGTTRSKNGVAGSEAYSKKSGVPMLRNLLLPRSKGLQAILVGLRGKFEFLYDITFYYDGIPEDSYGEVHFSLKNMYVEGKGPKTVRIHIRRFLISKIPYQDEHQFSEWLLNRWREKDTILELLKTQDARLGEPIKTKIQLNSVFEVFQPYLATALVVLPAIYKILR